MDVALIFSSRNQFFMEEHIEVEERITSVLAETMLASNLDNQLEVPAIISG